jgi:hypothetical protein
MFLLTLSTTIKPSLRMDDGLPFAEEQGQAEKTGMELAAPVTQASGTTPEKGKRKRTVTAKRLAAKTAKRDQRDSPVPADMQEEGHYAKKPDQQPKLGVAAERFGMYHKKGKGGYWDIPKEARTKRCWRKPSGLSKESRRTSPC